MLIEKSIELNESFTHVLTTELTRKSRIDRQDTFCRSYLRYKFGKSYDCYLKLYCHYNLVYLHCNFPIFILSVEILILFVR